MRVFVFSTAWIAPNRRSNAGNRPATRGTRRVMVGMHAVTIGRPHVNEVGAIRMRVAPRAIVGSPPVTCGSSTCSSGKGTWSSGKGTWSSGVRSGQVRTRLAAHASPARASGERAGPASDAWRSGARVALVRQFTAWHDACFCPRSWIDGETERWRTCVCCFVRRRARRCCAAGPRWLTPCVSRLVRNHDSR